MKKDQSIDPNEWDYTYQAPWYKYRPNYSDEAIDELLISTGARKTPHFTIADVGAGTANLSLMLLERGYWVIAIEPNQAMRTIGMERTLEYQRNGYIKWLAGRAENISLEDDSTDLFVMGSSFNCTDGVRTLNEAARVLKPGGFFSCMWNNRDIETDPIQKKVDEIIHEVVPEYEYGTRRADQTPLLEQCSHFSDIRRIQKERLVNMPRQNYINAWRSVKNRFWDQRTEEGRKTFTTLLARIEEALAPYESFDILYRTNIWMARKKI